MVIMVMGFRIVSIPLMLFLQVLNIIMKAGMMVSVVGDALLIFGLLQSQTKEIRIDLDFLVKIMILIFQNPKKERRSASVV